MAIVMQVASPTAEDRPSVLLEVRDGDGAHTPGVYANLIAGNEIELTAGELEWLIDVGGPAALTRMRETPA